MAEASLDHPSRPPTDNPHQAAIMSIVSAPHPAKVPSKASETGLSLDGAHAATDLK